MQALASPYETFDLRPPAPGIVVATLNRPERYNAMTATMFDELERAAVALDDEDDLRAVILTGAGEALRRRLALRGRGDPAAAEPARHARPAGAGRPGAGRGPLGPGAGDRRRQ